MSESSFSPHIPEDQRVQYDFDAIREEVEALLTDTARMAVMDPFDHLEWALALPLCMGLSRPPELLGRAAHRCSALGPRALHAHRRKTLDGWLERKRVLDPIWSHVRESLPSHVSEMFSPNKNILLLREILVSARFPDESLVDDLAHGFPLVGKLARSATLPRVPYPPVAETGESLLQQLGDRNDDIIRRVLASTVEDAGVALEMDEKCTAEMTSGRAREVPLATVVACCILTPRFPVDEGVKYNKEGVRVRKVQQGG